MHPTLSAADLRRLERDSTLEYVDDHLERKNSSRVSSRDAAKICFSFANHAKLAGLAVEVYGAGMGYRCHPDRRNWMRKPDASVVRLDRLVDVGEVDFLAIPADLAVEVNSPDDRQADVDRKVAEYLAAGFALVWVADPPTRTVRVHRPDTEPVLLSAADEITADPALPGFKCKVADLFA